MSDRVLKKIGQNYVANPEFQVGNPQIEFFFGLIRPNWRLASAHVGSRS